jgi:hypothetical protein
MPRQLRGRLMGRFSSWLARGRGGVAYETCARGPHIRRQSRAHNRPETQPLFQHGPLFARPHGRRREVEYGGQASIRRSSSAR